MQIVLDCEILGNILNCKSTGSEFLDFKFDETDLETFHHIFESDAHMEFKIRFFLPKIRMVNLLL